MRATWDDAECRGLTQFFFPANENERASVRDAREWLAKAICTSCPLTLSCIKLGIEAESQPEQHAPHGVWGGMTRAELLRYAARRDAKRRARRSSAHRALRRPDGMWECRCGYYLGPGGKGGERAREAQRRHVATIG